MEKVKHIVGFSGGIDSHACALLVLDQYPAGDVILTNSNAGGNEHPITERFIEDFSAKVHPVVKVNAIVADMWKTPGFPESKGYDGNAPLTFDLMAKIKGRFPSTKAQFCTEILKIRPLQRWIASEFGPTGPYAGWSYIRYAGIRRDESHARAETPIRSWDETFDCEFVRPIAEWNKQMCFDFVKAHGQEPNPLYLMGFGKVGCAPCINSSKEDIYQWQARSPDMIDKIERWEIETGRSFFPPFKVPGVNIPTVRQVVEWSKTMRGNVAPGPFAVIQEKPSCESRFGLCE